MCASYFQLRLGLNSPYFHLALAHISLPAVHVPRAPAPRPPGMMYGYDSGNYGADGIYITMECLHEQSHWKVRAAAGTHAGDVWDRDTFQITASAILKQPRRVI